MELLTLLSEKKRRQDFQVFAAECLKIKPKIGGLVGFTLNAAQQYLHARLEKQLAETGKVRALVLKGRQQGVSTYTEGRFYWKTSKKHGMRCFILTHEQDATDNLFDIAARYHQCDPTAPKTKAANAKELDFAALDSGYRVATAGTKAVGRSQTVHYFHWSEVAFSPNAKDHAAGVLQAVPDLPGTEIILESTANGVGGLFHEMWQEAETGQSAYQAIFIPWFWDDGYRKEVPPGFVLTEEEQNYKAAYKLDDSQMSWRRSKIIELRSEFMFKQEYPATAAEAFQVSDGAGYIPAEIVLAARKASFEGFGPLIIGADPARFGDDRFSLARRRGRKVFKVESRARLDTVEGANWVKQVIDTEKPSAVFIDAGGMGAGTLDILHSWGEPYTRIVRGVNFGGSPMEQVIEMENGDKEPGPKNRRAEMWTRSREWLEQVGGADIPDSDSLQADACGPRYKYDTQQRLVLESKEQMRARGLRSPDEWDAVALTFAEPVVELTPPKPRVGGNSAGSWMG